MNLLTACGSLIGIILSSHAWNKDSIVVIQAISVRSREAALAAQERAVPQQITAIHHLNAGTVAVIPERTA